MRHIQRLAAPLRFLAAILAAGSALAATDALAQGGLGDITVTPTRVVLEGRDRSGTITLANTGAAKATFRITLVNMRMTETGAFEEIPEGQARPGEQFAGDLIRYAPRQVTLDPGQTQTIRVAARKPAGLAPGEYRSHLLIRTVPESGAGQSIEAKPGQGLEISLAVIPGIALPVILRHGQTSAGASLSDFALAPARAGVKPSLTFRLNRSGNASVYGDLSATYFAPGVKEGVLISEVNQLAVYTPNPFRIVAMQLYPPAGVELDSGGRIVVDFREPPVKGGKSVAAGEYVIP